MEKAFEPVTKLIKHVSDELTKTMTANSIRNNQVLENKNNKLPEIMNDRGILATYLMSLLSKITNPENTSQLKVCKRSILKQSKQFVNKEYNAK